MKRSLKLLLRNLQDTLEYLRASGRKRDFSYKKAVFVCKGNICRSAFAEYLLKSFIDDDAQAIESYGLQVEETAPSPPAAIAAAAKFGIDMQSHLSKSWSTYQFDDADLILAMEYWQYCKLVEALPGKERNIRLLREFAPFPHNLLCNIDDPYGQDENQFLKCFSLIDLSLRNLNSLRM